MTILLLTTKDLTNYEVSRILENFQIKNIEVIIGHPNQFDLIVNGSGKYSVKKDGKDLEWPSLVLVRNSAAKNPAILSIMHEFENAGVKVINSPKSLEITRDKLRTSQILSTAKINVPKTMMFKIPVDGNLVEKELGFPCVVKVITGSLGDGVHLCQSKHEFEKLIEFISSLGNKKSLVVQEYIGEKPGEDLRVFIVGSKVVGAMKRKSINGDFRANIAKGAIGELYPLTDEIEEISIKTSKILGLEISGIDLLFDSRGFRVCEANSNPGFEGFEKHCGLDVAGTITEYIKSRLIE